MGQIFSGTKLYIMSKGRSPNGVLGQSYNRRNIIFLELFLDKTVSAGKDSSSIKTLAFG